MNDLYPSRRDPQPRLLPRQDPVVHGSWKPDAPLTREQVNHFDSKGYLVLENMFSAEEMALLQAETELHGGAGPRVSPFADVMDAAHLLQRAGFALPVADIDHVEVAYPDALALIRDLRRMGETNVLCERPRRPLSRSVMIVSGSSADGSASSLPVSACSSAISSALNIFSSTR